MATVLLSSAGGFLGGMIGGPIGAIAGRALGAIAGSVVDQQIINVLTPPTRREGPRLTSTEISTSTEGSVVDRIYGRARLPGHVIWATRFQEQIVTEETGGKGASAPKAINTTYTYAGHFAVGLCEGPVASFGRIWADGKEIDQTKATIRFYHGTDMQGPDPLIEGKETNAPAYRGLAYLVFEGLPLADWGNRLPQLSVEVYRSVGALEALVQGVAIIGTNEFGCDTEAVTMVDGPLQNRHTQEAETDWLVSIDRLEELAPALKSVMLVIPWFGSDLRAGSCTVRPKVDNNSKATTPFEWASAGLDRSTAQVVTLNQGKPAYGGSPNDASTIRAIRDLVSRGIDVTICPFMMMDVAADNALPNPHSDNAATLGQPAYPWRGRIVCSPAPGFAGTVDKTGTAAAQIASFVGTATAAHFGGDGLDVTYSGPDEWTYRRFVLHCAQLAKMAGGVEAMLVGSEMVGLSQVRGAGQTYPFVEALKALAGEVRTIVGSAVKIGYAADWSEYNNHRPTDGSGDVFFQLDALWSDTAIDFVGIDNYFPLADWRDGSDHLDFNAAGPTTIYDAAYLAANVAGGEYFDWYYSDRAARDVQARLPITDGAFGKPWTFRQKDVRSWWQNAHFNRPAGFESVTPTAWVPGSKPVRFIELGCPAVDKGANQPNLFPDPKSSEGAYPYYSSMARDDGMQRAYCAAMLGHYADPANNPMGVYGAPMLDLGHSHLWCWDARPSPSFPNDLTWGDAANWQTGHWLSGRLGAAPAVETIAAILADVGFTEYQIEPIPNVVDGVTTGALASARSMLDALRPAYQFDATESDGVIKFQARFGRAPVATILPGDLAVEEAGGTGWRQVRGQESELPDTIKVRFGDPVRDDQVGSTGARRSAGGSRRVLDLALPVIMAEAQATALAEMELYGAWLGRERAQFSLPPSRLALDAGDVVDFGPTGRLLRLSSIGEDGARAIEAFEVDPQTLAALPRATSGGPVTTPVIYSDGQFELIDGPLLADNDADGATYIVGTISPFRSGLVAFRSPSETGFTLDTILPLAATLGRTSGDFYPGPTGRWDRVNSLYVKLARGALFSAPEDQVLNGANPLLIQNGGGEWELLQFATATQTGQFDYILTDLLRGQRGTEHAMAAPVPMGARIVLVNPALLATSLPSALLGTTQNWRVGPVGEDIGSTRFVALAATLDGKARRPLSPAHLAGRRDPASGDWALSWMRRTRIGGDGWDQLDVPLGEASEAYRLQILVGENGAVLRTIDTILPLASYSAADQAADFGASQYSFWASVAQSSATVGTGIFQRSLIWVR